MSYHGILAAVHCFCYILVLDNNPALFAAVAQVSVLTENQPIPTSLQGESQMSMSLQCYAQMHTFLAWL